MHLPSGPSNMILCHLRTCQFAVGKMQHEYKWDEEIPQFITTE